MLGVCCWVLQKEMRAAEKGFWDEGGSGALNKPWVLRVLSVDPSTLGTCCPILQGASEFMVIF